MAAVDGVKAADMCLTILDIVASEGQGAGVTQIAQRVGIAKSAVFKHLQTLMDHGLVAQELETNRYRLGPKARLLARNAPDLDNIAEIAMPFMVAARNDLGLAVVLGAPAARAVFVMARVASNHPIEIGVKAGGQLSLHSSAQGKVALAFGAPEMLERVCSQPLEPGTPRSITGPAALRANCARVRELGYATAPEESLLGVNAIAAPIFNHTGALVGTVAFLGSVQHLKDPPDPAHVTRLLELARVISEHLGQSMDRRGG